MFIQPVPPYSDKTFIDIDIFGKIEKYFKNFEILSKSENWEEIINQGSIALEEAKKYQRSSDEAKICAQLTSIAFYMGNYRQGLEYATRCHELAEKFVDPSLFIQTLYLESAIYRALASKEKKDELRQAYYLRAVQISEEASILFSLKNLTNISLKGKIYFNLGAAHADNPQGNWEKAESYYSLALECFKAAKASDNVIRTKIRLAKVYLLRNDQKLCQQIIDEVRPIISNERLSMQADYLEAQLKISMNDLETAAQIVSNRLEKAKRLGVKEDEFRFDSLLKKILKQT